MIKVVYDEKLVPPVALSDSLSSDQELKIKQLLFEKRDAFCVDDQDVGCAENLQLWSKQLMHAHLTSKFLSNLRVPNAEVWKQVTKIHAKCSNIPTECSSKSFKFHSRSLLAHEVFKRQFQDGRA